MSHRNEAGKLGLIERIFERANIARAILVVALLAGLAGVSCSDSGDSTLTPESRVDTTMQSYLDELEALRDSLTEFGNPDGQGGSIQKVRDATNRLIGFGPFFAGLTQERQTYVNDRYGAELGLLLQQIANRAIGAVEISGEQEIALLIQQIPGLAATSNQSRR